MSIVNWAISSVLCIIPWGTIAKPFGPEAQAAGLAVQCTGLLWLIVTGILMFTKKEK